MLGFDGAGSSTPLGATILAPPIVWSFLTTPLESASGITAAPVLSADGETLFIGSNNFNIYAINAADGSQKWVYDTQGNFTFGNFGAAGVLSPDGTTLYIGECATQSLYAVNTATGALRWRYANEFLLTGCSTAIVVDNGAAVVASTLLGIDSFNASNGDVLWSFPPANASAGADGLFFGAGVLSANGTVLYFGSSDGNVYAVNALDGSVAFSSNTANIAGFHAAATLSLDGSAFFIGMQNGTVLGFRSADGHLLWSTNATGTGSFLAGGVVSRDGSTLYIGAQDLTLYAVDTADGGVRWASPTGSGSGSAVGVLSLDNSTIFINGAAVNTTTGEVLWAFPPRATGGAYGTGVLNANGTIIYLGSTDGFISAYKTYSVPQAVPDHLPLWAIATLALAGIVVLIAALAVGIVVLVRRVSASRRSNGGTGLASRSQKGPAPPLPPLRRNFAPVTTEATESGGGDYGSFK